MAAGGTPAKNLASALAIIGCLVLIWGLARASSPSWFATPTGEWIQEATPHWDAQQYILLQPGAENYWSVHLHYQPNSGQVVAWEAEKGQDSFEIWARWSPYGSAPQWREIEPNAVYERLNIDQAAVQFFIVSNEPQVFRAAVKRQAYGQARIDQYNEGLCTAIGCASALIPYADHNTIQKVIASSWWWYALGIVLLIAATLMHTGVAWLRVVSAVLFDAFVKATAVFLPSAVARRVRAGGSTQGAYGNFASNPFTRSVDIEELNHLLSKIKKENIRLRRIETELGQKGNREAAALQVELESTLARVKKLKDDLERLQTEEKS